MHLNLERLSIIVSKLDIYRFRNWYYYVGFYILGRFVNGIRNFEWPVILAILVSLAFSFSLNDYVDKGTRKFFVYPLLLIPVIYLFLKPYQLTLFILFILLSVLYSWKPRLKGVPILGSLCCTLAFPLFFLLGYQNGFSLEIKGILYYIFLCFFSALLQLIHEVNHLKMDKIENIRTTAVALGKRRVEMICLFICLLSIGEAFYLCVMRWINQIVFTGFLIFLFYLFFDIFINGISLKTWRHFMIGAISCGIVWFLSLYLNF